MRSYRKLLLWGEARLPQPARPPRPVQTAGWGILTPSQGFLWDTRGVVNVWTWAGLPGYHPYWSMLLSLPESWVPFAASSRCSPLCGAEMGLLSLWAWWRVCFVKSWCHGALLYRGFLSPLWFWFHLCWGLTQGFCTPSTRSTAELCPSQCHVLHV